MINAEHIYYYRIRTKKPSEVEIQHTKYNDMVKETRAQDGDCDKNMYEEVSDELHRMSTCPAYDIVSKAD